MTRTEIRVECPFEYGYGWLDDLVKEWNEVEPNHKLGSGGKGSYGARDMPIPLVQDIIEHFNGGEDGPSYNIFFKVYDPTYTAETHFTFS